MTLDNVQWGEVWGVRSDKVQALEGVESGPPEIPPGVDKRLLGTIFRDLTEYQTSVGG